MVPFRIEVPAGGGRYLQLEWFAKIDTGSPTSLIPAEVLPDPSRWETLPLFEEESGFHLSPGLSGAIRMLTCRALFGGVEFTDWLAVAAPRPNRVRPNWGGLLGGDFLSTFTVTFEYHKTPPVFHVKHPRAVLELPETIQDRMARIDGVGPRWEPGEGPWVGPNYTVSAEPV